MSNFQGCLASFYERWDNNVLTVQEAENANLGIPDDEVLAFAVNNNRAVMTLNRQDFAQLHRTNPNHAGIIIITNDMDRPRMTTRINEAITVSEPLAGKLIRVVRHSLTLLEQKI